MFQNIYLICDINAIIDEPVLQFTGLAVKNLILFKEDTGKWQKRVWKRECNGWRTSMRFKI
jgi:hypothetical protein